MDPTEYGEKFSTTVMNGYVALEIAKAIFQLYHGDHF
jgi:hypothetical protein